MISYIGVDTSGVSAYKMIDIICERLEGYLSQSPKFCRLSYSGGRDSHLILHIIRNVLNFDNNKFPAIYVDSRNDFFEISDRAKSQDVSTFKSPESFFSVAEREGLPLFSKVFSKFFLDSVTKQLPVTLNSEKMFLDFSQKRDWVISQGLRCSDTCCKLLKEDILKSHRANVVGLRFAEGGRRASGFNSNYDFCVKNHRSLFKPIFDVDDSMLSRIEKSLGVYVPQCYSFLSRTGCVFCGFGTKKQLQQKLSYLQIFEPSRFRFYYRYYYSYLKFRKVI